MATRARAGSGRAVEMERLAETGQDLGGSVEKVSRAMEGFGGATMALLPWTRQMIAVLWDQLRFLVHVIYYSFISVFQMFRFEVHVRITDDPSGAPDPSDPFLFSSLFSEEAGSDPTEALLSTLRGEELCCDAEGGIYIGHKRPAGWSATVGDWNFFVSSSEARCSSDEERSAASCWSSEEEHLEFDCEESKALWESLSRSGDPYDPFCFSACITTHSKAFWETEPTPADLCSPVLDQSSSGRLSVDTSEEESKESWETESRSSSVCTAACEKTQRESEESEALWETESPSADSCSPVVDHEDCVPVGRFWESSSEESSEAEDSPRRGLVSLVSLVRRSDSDSSWSSDNSENSESREENQLLWELFTKQDDPYNPLCFSGVSSGQEEALWRGLTKEHDPYHPLNFSALEPRAERTMERKDRVNSDTPPGTVDRSPRRTRRRRGEKPTLTHRTVQRHSHQQVHLRPWTRADRRPRTPSVPAPNSPALVSASRTEKKVRFSEEVQVHVMRSWDFARRSSRRGPWEELARDRDRFRRRIQDCERTVGPWLSPENREGVQRRIQTRIQTRTEDCGALAEPREQGGGPEEDPDQD